MPEHPTPAPALTDEQVDVNLKIIRDCAASLTRAVPTPGLVDRTVAAVIARAKREERARVAGLLRVRGYADAYRVVKESEADHA